MKLIFLTACAFLCVRSKSIGNNNSSGFLIDQYAKVTHWNSGDIKNSQGRSNSGQSLWTHRSDANIARGQNLNSRHVNKPKISYQYASAVKALPKVDEKQPDSSGIGEVIQDRFNPKPYFQYGSIPPKQDLSPVYKAPAPGPPPSKPPSVDLYTSSYSSYDPPPSGNKKPPASPPASAPAYLPPPNPPKDDKPDDNSGPPPDSDLLSLGPPLADMPAFPQSNPPSNGDGPPNYPPKDENDVYYPPDSNGQHPETILDHPPEKMEMPHPDMAEQDLSPPPSNSEPRFPQYLFDQGAPNDFDHHHDHHLYEEVTHPTTPKAEDERVNKGHYSYYYLGRKLWYVPLYFSVYFIIYVAVLILKSVARHKIEFKHHIKARSAREMDFGNSTNVDDVHQNVSRAIENVQNKYITDM